MTGVEPSEEEPDEPTLSDPAHAEPRPVDRWRRNTASGALTAALTLGLQQVFDPERKDTINIEQEAPTRPVDPDKLELRFDPLSSRGTVVVVHPRPDAEGGDHGENDQPEP